MSRPHPSLLKRIWQNSQTKSLAWTQGLSAAFLATVGEVNSFVTNPTFKDYLDKISMPPWFMFVLLGLAVITYVAHGHKDNNA